MRYAQAWDGKWLQPVKRGYRMRCCDCRLVHVLDFRIKNGRVQFKPKRDNRATAASRRKSKKKQENFMSPLMISIALWYHCRCDDFGKGNGDNNFDAAAVQEVLQEFVTAGLLARSPERSSQEYYGTEALTVYVTALRAVPWPVQKWIIPAAEAA